MTPDDLEAISRRLPATTSGGSLANDTYALLAEVRRLRVAIERHRRDTHYRLDQPYNIGVDGELIATPTRPDERLWAALAPVETP